MAKNKNNPPKRRLAKDSFSALVQRINKELKSLEFLLRSNTLISYWRVGRYISEALLENKGRAGYGEHFYERLARRTPVSSRTLERTVQFYQAYPIPTDLSELGWSHFLYLLTIKDQSKRKLLEKKAISEGWNSEELLKHIKALRQKEIQPKADLRQRRISSGLKPLAEIPQLSFTRGKLNCYRLLEPELLPSGRESELLIDLGFRMRREFPESKALGLEAGDCIRLGTGSNSSTSVSPGTGLALNSKTSLNIEKISATLEELFTYVACVQKIIDADTLWALIDAGFGRLIQQKLRLRGIDCPELSTPEGQRAKRFVQERLKNLDFIIIKTYKDTVDKYDRYLVDLFYPPQKVWRTGPPLTLRRTGLKDEKDPQKVLEEGIFLNQELLDKGLARHFA